MNNLLTLQDLINIKNKDNSEYKIQFGNFIINLYKNPEKYEKFLEKEPNWLDLDKKSISLIVSNMTYLCRKVNCKMKIYKWMLDKKFILKEPYFAMNAKDMLRIILLQESPYDYRKNNIFVSENVLSKI